MSFLATVVDFAGSVALLLWGVHMVETGIQRAFGARLRAFMATALRGRWKAFLAGLGVTAVLQSSTATGLIVSGMTARGLVELVPALAIMLGANVGTTLIVQVLSFDITAFAPVLLLLGVVMFRRGAATTRDLGRVAIGLGLMLIALSQLLSLVAGYENMPGLRAVLAAIGAQPVANVLLAAAVTWAAHSSVAIVLLVMSLAAKGVLAPAAAFAMVLGANLGTAVNPVLESATGDDLASKRLPIGNLMSRVLGVVVAVAILPLIARWMAAIAPAPARAVADFHTLFNLVLAAALLPLLGPCAALLRRALPARIDPADPARPIYLDPAARDTPPLALGGAAREALRLADVLELMLQGLRDAFAGADRARIGETRRMDDVLDKLNSAIKAYLTSLDHEAMTEADQRRVSDILGFATNLEQAGDVIERDLLDLVAKMRKRGLVFSAEARAELLGAIERLMANVRAAASLFATDDARAARLLAREKQAFRDMEQAATERHFARLRAGRTETADTSALYLDMMRDLKRVNAHLVAGAAYSVLAREGELLPSRLKEDG